MKIIEKIVESRYTPKQTNVVWLDVSGNKPVKKSYINGKWVIIGSGNINYSYIIDKPQINGVELDGNKTTEELGISTMSMTETTYEELKELRDNSQLTPGALYRITDYTCTTTQSNAQSAGHVFDIIVRADDASHLNENAFAALHEGDTYFSNCQLESWKLKYCIDNDTTKFKWADDRMQLSLSFPSPLSEINTTADLVTKGTRWKWKRADNNTFIYTEPNPTSESVIYASTTGTLEVLGTINSVESFGKGVVFYMLDERGNECYYDFKNIMVVPYNESSGYYYTFDAFVDSQHYDLSVSSQNKWCCNNNKIEKYIIDSGSRLTLNWIVFKNTGLDSRCYSNTFSYSCNDTKFGNNCFMNKFGENCYKNIIGDYCQNNVVVNNFYRNTIGNGFMYNVIKDLFIYTPIGNNFKHNTVGYCSYSRFGNNIFYLQSFGEIKWCDFTGGTSEINPIENVNTIGYLHGTGSQNKLVISFEEGKEYAQFATLAIDPSGQLTLQERLKIWSEEDKQDILISGTNIKTINGESILGSGNLVVEGGTVSLPATIDCVTLREPTSEELSNLPQAPSHKVYTNTVIDLVTNQLPKEFWIEENQSYIRMILSGLKEYSDTYIANYSDSQFLVSLDGSFMILLEQESI